jgi:hypothetical protein
MIEHDVHHTARHAVVRDPRNVAADHEAASRHPAMAPPRAAHHRPRQVDAQIVDLGLRVKARHEPGQRAVAATDVVQRKRPAEIAQLQELDEAQLLGRRAGPVDAARGRAVTRDLVAVVRLDAGMHRFQRGRRGHDIPSAA